MKDVLMEYVMKVDAYAPTPSASTAYIRKVLAVVKPLDSEAETTGTIIECTTKAEVEALTSSKAYKLLEAGMNSIYVLPATSLDIADIITESKKKFFTILIDNAFSTSELEELEVGSFAGVIGKSFNTRESAKAFTIQNNNVGFYDLDVNASENMFHAFGKLLSANSFKNQQYIEMPLTSEVNTINQAELLFEDGVSFVLTSEEFGNRLSLFASNRRAIVAPYVFEELTLKLQSKALQYIELNEPNYTEAEASLLEDSLQTVIDGYIEEGLLTSGNITVSLTDENFVVKATITVPEPKAMWRIKATMRQGEI